MLFGGSALLSDGVPPGAVPSAASFGGRCPALVSSRLNSHTHARDISNPRYMPNDPKARRPGRQPSVAFKSRNPQRPKPSHMDTPAPSSYDVRGAPQHPSGPTKATPFSTTERRFDIKTTVLAGRMPESSNPAPSSYSPKKSTRVSGGRVLDHQKQRFAHPTEVGCVKTPGANAYTLSGTHAHSTYKPTFNASLDHHLDPT